MLQFCKKQNHEQGFWYTVFLPIFVLILSACSHHGESFPQEKADSLLWNNLDECLQLLDAIDVENLSEDDRKVWELTYAHAFLRKNSYVHDVEALEYLATDFREQGKHRYAGEAYYLLGTHYEINNQAYLATYYLKYAEWHLRNHEPTPDQLLGHTYHRLGSAAREERLSEMAHDYFLKCIPYEQEAKNNMFLASAYECLALTTGITEKDKIISLLDTARYYAEMQDNRAIREEIKCWQLIFSEAEPTKILAQHKLLCDSLYIISHGAYIAEYYLSKGVSDSARQYLDILVTDTMSNVWTKEHYEYSWAEYLAQTGQIDSAYHALQRLHLRQTDEIERSEYSRSYIIAQQFQVAEEEAKALQAQLERNRILIWGTICLLIILVFVAVGIYHYQRRHYLQQEKIWKQEKAIEDLKALQKENQHVLQEKLRGRLQQAQGIQRILYAEQHVDVPEWAKEYYQSLLLSSPKQLGELIEEANHAFGHLFQGLQEQHEHLTTVDLTIITLMLLDFSIEDSCILLNNTKSTMYNRRQRIRQHLELPADMSLEDWIAQQKG